MTKSLEELLTAQYGLKTTVRETYVSTAGMSAVNRIVRADPNRVGLLIINSSNVSLYIGLRPNISVATSLRLGASGGVLGLSWTEDMTLTTREWHGMTQVAAGTVLVIETLIYGGQ